MAKSKIPTPTEEQEQIAFIEWCDLQPEIKGLMVHIPNGGSRHILEAVKFKKMGVRKGFPDLFLPIPRGPYHGLLIEMKRRNTRLNCTEEQKRWINKLCELGYFAIATEGCDNAIEMTKIYLYGFRAYINKHQDPIKWV